MASEVCLYWNSLANEDSLYHALLIHQYPHNFPKQNESCKEAYIAAVRTDKPDWYLEGLFECSKCNTYFWGAKKHSLVCASR